MSGLVVAALVVITFVVLLAAAVWDKQDSAAPPQTPKTPNDANGEEEEYPDWPPWHGHPDRQTGCPNCGGRNIAVETLHDRHSVASFADFYHPGEGVFKFELDCNVCEWSEKRQVRTEVVDE